MLKSLYTALVVEIPNGHASLLPLIRKSDKNLQTTVVNSFDMVSPVMDRVHPDALIVDGEPPTTEEAVGWRKKNPTMPMVFIRENSEKHNPGLAVQVGRCYVICRDKAKEKLPAILALVRICSTVPVV